MKNIYSKLFVFAVFLVLAVPFVLADEQAINETGDVDQETEDEIESMDTQNGAEMRLLELQKAIDRNIVHANEVIAVIKEKNNDSANITAELESLVTEMQTLLTDVKALDPAANDSVRQFVDAKADAIDLIQSFREKAKVYLTDADKDKIRTEAQEQVKERLQNISAQIKAAKINLNAERFVKIFAALNITDTSIIDQYKAGTVDANDVMAKVRESLKTMTVAERKAAQSALKEQELNRVAYGKTIQEKVKENFQERKEQRLEQRLEKLDLTESKIKERIEERKSDNEKAGNGNEKSDNDSDKADNDNGKAKGGAD